MIIRDLLVIIKLGNKISDTEDFHSKKAIMKSNYFTFSKAFKYEHSFLLNKHIRETLKKHTFRLEKDQPLHKIDILLRKFTIY